ncbi:MAG: hypothetical protein WBD42_04435 [Methylovirgula sp.]|jgi:hypothetical protein
MQHSRVLRATVCTACLLIGGTAFAQGVNYSTPRAGFTKVAAQGGVGGIGGGGHGGFAGGFHGGGMHGGRSVHGGFAGGFHGGGMHGGHNWGGHGGWGPNYAFGWGYPYGYGGDYDYPGDYADDYGYPYDTYAEGAYCQTPQTSCPLSHPAPAGAACSCDSGISPGSSATTDYQAGAVEP